MKKYIGEFFLKGMIAMGCGPIVLALVYYFLGVSHKIESINVNEIALGIITVSFMAFVAAGVSVVYKIERLPIFYAILIHGAVLYFDYILVYLVNGWLKTSFVPILIFSVVFVLGYCVIWAFIYLFTKRSAKRLSSQINNPKGL